MRYIALLIVCVTAWLLTCCSAERVIATSSTSIGALAHNSRSRFVEIREQSESNTPDLIVIREQAVIGEGEQSEIIDAVTAIIVSLPGVQDTAPWWAASISWLVIGLAILASIIVIVQSGALHVVRAWMVRMFVPRA